MLAFGVTEHHGGTVAAKALARLSALFRKSIKKNDFVARVGQQDFAFVCRDVSAENAEAMPFADETFDSLSSVFLFHELPSDARRNVAAEALRVLKPGGLFAVIDSIQLDDAPEMAFFVHRFPRIYHEPYYKGYVSDPLPALLREVGFDIVSDRDHFVSRAVVARRPAAQSATAS